MENADFIAEGVFSAIWIANPLSQDMVLLTVVPFPDKITVSAQAELLHTAKRLTIAVIVSKNFFMIIEMF
jgi:hypothetical protein